MKSKIKTIQLCFARTRTQARTHVRTHARTIFT